MNIIITGGSGFIGKNFILKNRGKHNIFALYNKDGSFPKFLQDNDLKNVTPIKCDLTKEDEVKRMFEKISSKLDACLYLAANSDPTFSVTNPIEDCFMNIVSILNFLKYFHGGKFIFLSSSAVYCDGVREKVSPDIKLDPTLPYSISKVASEQYIKFYRNRIKSFDNYVILRFFGAYGPHEPGRKIYTKLVEAFHIRGENSFTIRGNGQNLIDAMFIDDAVEGLSRILESDKGDITVDFCVGKPLTIEDLVKIAATVFGKKDAVINKIGKAEEYTTFAGSPETFYRLFNFRPKIDLETGFKTFAKFLENLGKNKRKD